MLARIRRMFRSDAYIPTTAVFPSIDAQQLARDLRLVEVGRERGEKNQPSSSASDFDHVETGIVEAVEALRRKGLDNYENNRRVYNERLARAGQASQEIDIAAGEARNDFGATVHQWRSAIVSARERLNESYVWRNRFREIHGLERPAVEFHGWANIFITAAILIILESFMNSYLFSKGNEFGLLGGLLAAVIVSLVNVGASILMGYLARYVRVRNVVIKLIAFMVIFLWIAFALMVNLAVAHFRDSLASGADWDTAAAGVVASITTAPLDLASIESWLLAILGILVSVLSFRKGWHSDDPYPGYGRVQRQLDVARERYEEQLSAAIAELEDRRDKAKESLQDADDEVRSGITEAVDALFGQSSLNTHLGSFLEQCNLKLAHLLAVYRDANRAARSEPPPPSFEKGYRFTEFRPDAVDLDRRTLAEQEARKVNETVQRAIADIFDRFDEARRAFLVTDDVEEGGAKPGRTQPGQRGSVAMETEKSIFPAARAMT